MHADEIRRRLEAARRNARPGHEHAALAAAFSDQRHADGRRRVTDPDARQVHDSAEERERKLGRLLDRIIRRNGGQP